MKRVFKRLLSFWAAAMMLLNVIVPTGAMAITVTVGGQEISVQDPYGVIIDFGSDPVTIPSGYYLLLKGGNQYDADNIMINGSI